MSKEFGLIRAETISKSRIHSVASGFAVVWVSDVSKTHFSTTISTVSNGEVDKAEMACGQEGKAAISTVQLREGRFDDALQDGMLAFAAKPHSATARLVGKIYKEAGMDAKARHWFERAEYLEEPEKEEITQAHIAGLLKLAHSVLSNCSFSKGGTGSKT